MRPPVDYRLARFPVLLATFIFDRSARIDGQSAGSRASDHRRDAHDQHHETQAAFEPTGGMKHKVGASQDG